MVLSKQRKLVCFRLPQITHKSNTIALIPWGGGAKAEPWEGQLKSLGVKQFASVMAPQRPQPVLLPSGE